MSTKYIGLILIVCLVLGVLACILAGILVLPNVNLKGNPNSLSVRDLTLTMDVDQREEFFSQMRKFADKHSLEFTLMFFDADQLHFLFVIRGDSFHITGADLTNQPREIGISFFNDASTPTPEETIDELFNDFKSFIGEIPNVRMSEVRKRLRIKIDESQREEFFTQMRKLADEHSLEFRLSFSSDKTLYLLEIYGDGFHILSEARSNRPEEIDIAFFLDYYQSPTPTSLETVDELFVELKGLLSETPSVTIVEEK